jgi:RES domain
MPATAPPRYYNGNPNKYLLRRGSCLWRVHASEHKPWAFNPQPSDTLFGGARFDATHEQVYPFYYAALEEETALTEALLRDVPPDQHGYRALTRAAVQGRHVSALVLTSDLALVSLISGEDLATIGQDAWLITCGAKEYPQTRGWAHWLRDQAKWAFGFAWTSSRNMGGTAIVLFGDRCAAVFGSDYQQTLLYDIPPLSVDLADDTGTEYLTERFRAFHIGIAPPAT